MFTTGNAPAVNAELSSYRGATGPSLWPGCDCLGVGIALEQRVWWDRLKGGSSAAVLELKNNFLLANKGNATLAVRVVGAVHKCSTSPGDQKHRTVIPAPRYLVWRAGTQLFFGDGLFLPCWWVVLCVRAGHLQFLCKRRTKATGWWFPAVQEPLL